jgi:hypothetical protein
MHAEDRRAAKAQSETFAARRSRFETESERRRADLKKEWVFDSEKQ